jgi:RNA polymerase sigma-70 factor (ECF subfamily)
MQLRPINQVVALEEAKPGANRARLMGRAQCGDKEALGLLFAEIGPLITGFVRRRLRDQVDADDICQEALLAIFKSRHTYQPARPFEPWLFAIVRNVMAGYLQRNRQHSGSHESISEMKEIGAESESTMAIELSEGFSQLSAAQLEALKLTKLAGFSIAEAAARAGTSVASMKVRVHRAYVSLKRSMLR